MHCPCWQRDGASPCMDGFRKMTIYSAVKLRYWECEEQLKHETPCDCGGRETTALPLASTVSPTTQLNFRSARQNTCHRSRPSISPLPFTHPPHSSCADRSITRSRCVHSRYLCSNDLEASMPSSSCRTSFRSHHGPFTLYSQLGLLHSRWRVKSRDIGNRTPLLTR